MRFLYFFVVVMYFLYFILNAKILINNIIERVATFFSPYPVRRQALLEDDIKAITGNPNSAVHLPHSSSSYYVMAAPPETKPEP